MELNQKETRDFTIVVTDSGLGGLSVAAGLENQLRVKNCFGKVNIIFFNSLAASDFGYNSMSTLEKKAEVFGSALNAMTKAYNPDIILIACNTLSVVYDYTSFSKKTPIDVLGIIDLGAEMVIDEFIKNNNVSVLLLGTPTTISSLSYNNKLTKKGIKEESIINQSCPMLETAIQQDPESEIVYKMINDFLIEAKSKELNNSEKLIAALCCTHYGYSENIFNKTIENIFNKPNKILNPNKKMVEVVIEKIPLRKNELSRISVKVVSQVELKNNEISSISNVLKNTSPITALALKNYTFDISLFSFHKD
jgi:glutamate racemase